MHTQRESKRSCSRWSCRICKREAPERVLRGAFLGHIGLVNRATWSRAASFLARRSTRLRRKLHLLLGREEQTGSRRLHRSSVVMRPAPWLSASGFDRKGNPRHEVWPQVVTCKDRGGKLLPSNQDLASAGALGAARSPDRSTCPRRSPPGQRGWGIPRFRHWSGDKVSHRNRGNGAVYNPWIELAAFALQ